MHIVHLVHGAALGGAERSMIELACSQRDLGHRVTVAVGRSEALRRPLEEAGLFLVDLRWPKRLVSAPRSSTSASLARLVPAALRGARNLRRLVALDRPAVVQAHTRKTQLLSAVALLGTPGRLIWHLRDDVPDGRAQRLVLRFAMRRVDHAVTLTDWLANRYQGAGLLPRSGRIGVVPSSIDPALLSRLPTPFLDGSETPVVGYVGQIAEWKAPHLLIDAAERLSDLPNLRFRIVGDVFFSPAEDQFGRWLRDRLERSPARDRIEWLGRVADPVEAFRGIDVLVHTSSMPEPFGRVLVEAMAARRPIVSVRHASTADLLDDSTAVLADRPDGASVAAAIRTIMTDRALARRLAEAGVERSRRFEPRAVGLRMEREYRDA